jgi:hypothetical protein
MVNKIKIIFSIVGLCLTILGILSMIIFFNQKKKINTLNIYYKKLDKILKEKIENEKNINNSNYDDYNNNGTSKSGKNK